MTQLQKLVEILDANNIDYAKKFDEIEVRGYDSDECRSLSYEIRQDIENLLKIGFRQGIDANIENAITNLTKIAVQMSKYKVALDIDKYVSERQKIMQITNKYRGDKIMVDIKQEVLKYIDDSLSGLENLIVREKAGYNVSILNTSKELLEELRQKVDNVYDTTSKQANEKALDLLGDSKYGLFAWRDYLGRNMIFDSVNDHIREAIDEADKWSAITEAPRKRDIVDESKAVKYEPDIFTSYSKLSSVQDKGDAFFARLKDFEQQFSVQSEYYDKIKEVNSQIMEIQKEIGDIMQKMDNGEIYEEEADIQISMLEQDIEIKEDERNQYRASIRMMNNNILAMRRLITKFKRLEFIYRMYQQIEPNLFYTMFSYIDFRQFINVLSYGASEDNIVTALSYYDNIMENVAEQTKHMSMTDNRFDVINKAMQKYDEKIATGSSVKQEDKDKEKEELRKRMEERRKRYGKKPETQPAEEQNQDKQEETIQNLDVSISDIINNG